jgi:hypothetical protein
MSPTRMSRLESAARVTIELNQAFNRHDVAGMMQLVSDDCVFENADPAPDGSVHIGKEAITTLLQGLLRQSPNAHIKIEDIFGFGDRCIMRWRRDWEDAAENKLHVRGVDIIKEKNGFICEKLSYVKSKFG